jgi:hypothetical protein
MKERSERLRHATSGVYVSGLKGQCHEMNISFEGPKNRNTTFLMTAIVTFLPVTLFREFIPAF